MWLDASGRDDAAIALNRLMMIAFGLVQPAQALVAVMHVGEVRQHIMGGLLGFVELLGVDEGESMQNPGGSCGG